MSRAKRLPYMKKALTSQSVTEIVPKNQDCFNNQLFNTEKRDQSPRVIPVNLMKIGIFSAEIDTI
jgi:hypothetical protein